MSQQIVNGRDPGSPPNSQNSRTRSPLGGSKSSSSFSVISPPSTYGNPVISNPPSRGNLAGSLTDITLEQAQERVNNLSSENYELREYLKENNDMMKQQYQIMSKWREKIHETSALNKQKAGEAQKVIKQLKNRNDELLAMMKESQSKSPDVVNALQDEKKALMKEVECLREQLATKHGNEDLENMETVYVTESDEKIKVLQHECQSFRQQAEQLLLDLQTTQSLKDGMRRDLLSAQSEIQKLKVANQNLIDRCNCLERKDLSAAGGGGGTNPNNVDISISNLGLTICDPQKVGNVQEHAPQIQLEKMQMGAEQVKYNTDENAELNQKNERTENESPSYNSDVQSLKSQVLTLINEVHESQTKLAAASNAVDVFKARAAAWEQKCHEQEEGARQYKMEDGALIGSLKDALTSTEQVLKSEKDEHQNTKKQLTDVRTSFNNLFKDYSDLLEVAKKTNTPQEQASVQQPAPQETQTKQLLDDINALTAKVIAAEEAIAYREDHIKQLQHANNELKRELDNIVPVLKAQAEVFKADFDAERKARERQHTEKEKLIQDMHNLQVQNQQLLDEVENLSKRQLMEMQQRHAHGNYGQTLHNYINVVGSNQPIGARGYNYDTSVSSGAPSSRDGISADTSSSTGPQSRLSEPSQHDEGEHQVFSCPKCDIVCPDVDTLQIHVLECIDQN